jgi:hypothetical protein
VRGQVAGFCAQADIAVDARALAAFYAGKLTETARQVDVEAFAHPRRIDRGGHGPFVKAAEVALGVRERAAQQFVHVAELKAGS